MIVRSVWSNVPVPEHSTSDEVCTIPNDSSTIQELFERAVRGQSLGGSYDEFEDDSIFDDIHDPDMQDPLLREANRLNVLEDVTVQSRELVKNSKRKKRQDTNAVKDTSSSSVGDLHKSESSGENIEGES